ncbi:MAG TPA: septal ring lytic transglycosylase RlpA family protein [Acidimicrobiales bacterium]|nr:septal ring lytic transglycosylase RlpA family protein [Acidimicrobiales bacterium]
MSIAFRRVWLLINIVVTVALLPALFPDQEGGPGTAVAAGAGVDTARAVAAVVTTSSTAAVPTTTTTIAPVPATTPVTAAPKAAPTTTTTAKPKPKPTTTTTEAPPPPPPPSAPAASGSESGRATWYDYRPGICAHKTLPFGTVVTVHAVNGKSVQCTVGDRGPFVDGYVIDLHWQEFEQLAPRSTGRIDVTITW